MKRLVLILLFALCLMPCFGAGESGVKLGGGSLGFTPILVIASSTENLNGAFVPQWTVEDYDTNNAFVVSTFTAPMDCVVTISYRVKGNQDTGQFQDIYTYKNGILYLPGCDSIYSYSSGLPVVNKVTTTVRLLKGETLGFSGYSQRSTSNCQLSISIMGFGFEE